MKVAAPRRAEHSCMQTLVAPREVVFPLLCPVLEARWIEDWDPVVVYSHSGVAEQDCVFQTRGPHRRATWIVTEHDPARFRLVFAKVDGDVLATVIRIRLQADGSRTRARISYSHTALNGEGEALVAAFTQEAFAEFMREEWEGDLNRYLRRQLDASSRRDSQSGGYAKDLSG